MATRSRPDRTAADINTITLDDGTMYVQEGRVLQETGLPARQLDIELTESMVMSDADRAKSGRPVPTPMLPMRFGKHL